MKKITLKSITLENFKGIKKKEVKFNENITKISGTNGTGKTTIFDAFTWCFSGKDSHGKTDFEIKTIGLSKAEHSVLCVINVDDTDYSYST